MDKQSPRTGTPRRGGTYIGVLIIMKPSKIEIAFEDRTQWIGSY